MKKDVSKDGNQRCSYMCGVYNCRSPYPFATTCMEAKKKTILKVLKQAEFGDFKISSIICIYHRTTISHTKNVLENKYE